MNNIVMHMHHHQEMPKQPFFMREGSMGDGHHLDGYQGEDRFIIQDVLPEFSSFLKDIILQKKAADESFLPRRFVVTESRLYFAHPDDERVLDDIPLHEILEISQSHSVGRTISTSSSHNDHTRQDSVLAKVLSVVSSKQAGTEEADWGGDEFCLTTAVEGHNSGRQYYLKCDDGRACRELVGFLNEMVKASVKREVHDDTYTLVKRFVRETYKSGPSAGFWALLIFLPFISNVLEAQLDPAEEDADFTAAFYKTDMVFTILFTIELVINMFGHWFWEFWQDSWNVFDFFVVGVSLISLALSTNGANAVRSVRLVRAFRSFRVMRLFGRLQSIRKIIVAAARSLAPVGNAFFIVLLIMAIYAIIGVQLFRQYSEGAFGDFGKSMYTMFGITTMDGWQELVMMPMILSEADVPDGSELPPGMSETVPRNGLMILFIVSYFVVVVWTMLPIVVAILLENFTNAAHQLEFEEHHTKMQNKGIEKMQHTLDPMVRMLTHYNTDSDLSHKIHHLYLYLLGDSDVKGGLDFKTMAHGLKRRHWKEGGIHLSLDDFDAFTCNGVYADERGCMSEMDFEAAARLALQHFVARQIAKYQFLCESTGKEAKSAILMGIKAMGTMPVAGAALAGIDGGAETALDHQDVRKGKRQLLRAGSKSSLGSPLAPSLAGQRLALHGEMQGSPAAGSPMASAELPNRQAAKPAAAHSASVGERSCIDSSGCATVDSSQKVLEALRCLGDSQRVVERKVDKAMDRLEQACARLDRVCRHLNLSEDSELSDSTGRIAGSNGSDASKAGLGLRSHAVTSRKERAREANDVVGASFVAVQKGNAASKDSVDSVEVGEKGVSDEARHLKDAKQGGPSASSASALHSGPHPFASPQRLPVHTRTQSSMHRLLKHASACKFSCADMNEGTGEQAQCTDT